MTEPPKNTNPYNHSQRKNQPHTIKWCAWEILTTEDTPIATEERLREIIIQRELRTEIKAASIAKELGSDKRRFVSSPEGWSIIPSFDEDVPNIPTRATRNPTAATAQAPNNPAKRKTPPEKNLEDSGNGRRRTKSASEWWKVDKTDEAQQHDAGGRGELQDNEDEEIDIMTGGVTPVKNMDTVPALELLLPSKKEEEKMIEEKKQGDDDGAVKLPGQQPTEPVAAPVVEEPSKKDSPPVAMDTDKLIEKPAAAAEKTEEGAEAMVEEKKKEGTKEEKKKESKPTKTKSSLAEPALPTESKPIESTEPAAAAAAVPPAAQGPKPFIIPKRSAAGTAAIPTTNGPITGGVNGGGSKDASGSHRHRKESSERILANGSGGGGGGGSGSRWPASIPDPTAAGTAGRAGKSTKPPLPLPPRKIQPWETMLADINGSFARAWKQLEWPSSSTLATLPQPIDPSIATEEQKEAWKHAKAQFGAPPAPAAASVLAAPTTDGSPPPSTLPRNQESNEVLHPLTQDPYPPHPPDLNYVRIMQCPGATVQQCLDRLVFASNHHRDTEGIEVGRALIVLHDFDKHTIYGCYRAVEVGRMLDASFGHERCHQVRVEPLQVFSPMPSYLFEAFLPRKFNHSGQPMKFFEKGTPAVKELWHLMQLYSKKCTSKEVLRSTYGQFALPQNPNQLKIYFQGDIWCPQQEDGGRGVVSQGGVLFSFGELDAFIDCNGRFILNGGILGQIMFPLQLNTGSNALQFILSIDKLNERPVGLWVEGAAEQAATATQPPELLKYIKESSLLSNGLTIGPRSTNIPAIRASISRLVLESRNIAADLAGSNEALGASPLPVPPLCLSIYAWNGTGLGLDACTAANTLPEVTSLEINSANGVVTDTLEVEEEVEIRAVAKDIDGDDLKLEIIVYGVPPENCSKTTCGDATFASTGDSSGSAQVAAKIKFPLPGRYIVRARVSDGFGRVIWKDVAVAVYKKGDALRAAPCCRTTSYIIGHNLGRPVDRTRFRAKGSETAALGSHSGWSSEYWNGADVEAERLFDYSILASQMEPSPVETLTCADVRIGGAGGPEVYGLLWAGEDVLGHGKSLTIVPETFESWATGPADVECVKHWSVNSNSSCVPGCTSAMVENHIHTTGMVDQYSQALVQLSYGALQVSPRVRVLPEVQVAREPMMPWDSVFGYYDTPSRLAVEASGHPRPWMVLTLAPLAHHKTPKHRAWSSGLASGSATITKCFASMYYAVHETGHRLGFKHGQLLKLAAGHAVPADPLQSSDPTTEIVPDEGYAQRLDIMSCCKSDYGLFHRTVAGWTKNSKRTVISQDELTIPSAKKFILWPFDRSESRGKHISLAIRRSDDEVLLIGFRSVSHWQEQDSDNNSENLNEDHRLNVRGLQVEYMKRNPNKGTSWGDRSILDFNVMHGDYPHALPLRPGEVSRQTQFSLFKEARSWYDPTSRLLLSFERIAECDGTPEVNVYNYGVTGFYGYNGEWPGKEAFTQHDYNGFGELSCAHISVTTAAKTPQGKLDVDVQLQEELHNEIGVLRSQNMACINSNSNSSSSSVPSLLNIKLTWNAELNTIASIVWKDHLNRTLQASYSERFILNSNNTGTNTISVLPASLPITAHLLALDGRHSRVEITTEKLSTTNNFLVVATKRYYQLTEKIISDSPLIILGTVPECTRDQMDLTSKRKHENALILWLLIIGALLAALLLGGAIMWIVTRIWRRQWRGRENHQQIGKADGTAQRKTTVAALAEAIKECTSTPASKSSR